MERNRAGPPALHPSRRPVDQAGGDGGLPRLSAIIVTGGTRSRDFLRRRAKAAIVGEKAARSTATGAQHHARRGRLLEVPPVPLTLRPQFITTPPASSGHRQNNS